MTKLLESKEDKELRLHNAANNDEIVELEALLAEDSVDVDCRGNIAEWTPLHAAASNGHVASINVLLKYAATIDIPDKVSAGVCAHADRV
jgi:ankyrin repeat protein